MKENIDISKLNDDGSCSHLINRKFPDISLPNQDGHYLKLNRSDTFRLVIYFYSLTGHPKKNFQKIGIRFQAQMVVHCKIVLLEIIMKR